MDPQQFVITADGSKTIYHPVFKEHYHSVNGALQESRHVFIEAGLKYVAEKTGSREIRVLEVGLGTGLNFLLSADYCKSHAISLRYCGVEAYPLSLKTIAVTGYQEYVDTRTWKDFLFAYEPAMKQEIELSPGICLTIRHQQVQDYKTGLSFDLIYFDAFASASQPEMWSADILGHVIRMLKPGGVFVTYAVNAGLKKTLLDLGCHLEKLPGAAGKREMLRASVA
ncbi:MAG TPA: tRNA (5-methylaminomethyl-2-thiouridine)(34)-methyltransferase MnmD [Puia sp.]|nr:tRNA (5-methylaminomethyl-2-thiouridine)(34)-methyltransferase MnmD [Puia sp.]